MSERELLHLQEIDLELDHLRSRRAHIESGADLSEAQVAKRDAETRMGDLRLQIDELSRDQTRLENEIESMRLKADAERKRLYDGSVANAKELEAMQHEISNVDERRGRAEDDLLEMMERREGLDAELAEAEKAFEGATATILSVGESGARELDRIASDLGRLDSERSAALAAISDEDLLELYEDLRASKHGIGAAALEDGVCQGCHQKLSALEIDRLRKSPGIKRCDYCRRILVL
jgi:predicted  nucleic acid-binding Zn-ribbon protein